MVGALGGLGREGVDLPGGVAHLEDVATREHAGLRVRKVPDDEVLAARTEAEVDGGGVDDHPVTWGQRAGHLREPGGPAVGLPHPHHEADDALPLGEHPGDDSGGKTGHGRILVPHAARLTEVRSFLRVEQHVFP